MIIINPVFFIVSSVSGQVRQSSCQGSVNLQYLQPRKHHIQCSWFGLWRSLWGHGLRWSYPSPFITTLRYSCVLHECLALVHFLVCLINLVGLCLSLPVSWVFARTALANCIHPFWIDPFYHTQILPWRETCWYFCFAGGLFLLREGKPTWPWGCKGWGGTNPRRLARAWCPSSSLEIKKQKWYSSVPLTQYPPSLCTDIFSSDADTPSERMRSY